MRYLVYNVRYSVVAITSSQLTITLYSSFITTHNIILFFYNDTKYSPFHDTIYQTLSAYEMTQHVPFI